MKLRLTDQSSLCGSRQECGNVPRKGTLSRSLCDHGPGVPEKDLEAILEPFHRLESARERATGGVGLGLAIVKSCMETCQGSITCRNRKPTGLEVQMRIPIARTPSTA